MTFSFGKRSEQCLQGVHPDLVWVVRQALAVSMVDFAVIEGLRSIERQRELYAQGRTKPGRVVTWTMQSKHIRQPDGFGHAVDLLPVNPVTGILDWNFNAGFQAISAAMFTASDALRIAIRWGRDWDRDGVIGEMGEGDAPHYELFKG